MISITAVTEVRMDESYTPMKRVHVPGYDDVDLIDLPLAVIDFETTGFSATKGRIVEYGFALFKGGKCTTQVGGFLNPGMEIPEEAQKVHGITDEDVKHAPSFLDVVSLFVNVLDDRVPVAYNAPFDRRFLMGEIGRVDALDADVDIFEDKTEWIDPLVWVRHFFKYSKGKKLTDMCPRLGVELEGAHRAMNDAKATGEVLMKLLPKFKEAGIDTKYARLIERQQNMGSAQELDYQQWRARQEKKDG
jgi:DNA polymerase III epsilon subunit family exonuclease